jgi:hypothetical protein
MVFFTYFLLAMGGGSQFCPANSRSKLNSKRGHEVPCRWIICYLPNFTQETVTDWFKYVHSESEGWGGHVCKANW